VSQSEQHGQALEYAKSGQIDKAHELYSSILSIEPTDPDALHFFAVISFHKKNYVETIEKSKKALLSRPGWVKALNTLGCAYKELGDYQQALGTLYEGNKISPDNGEISLNIGSIEYQNNNFDIALSFLEKAHKQLPSNADVLVLLSDCYRSLEKFDLSLKLAKRAIQYAPKNAEAHNACGNALQSMQNPTDAITAFETAIELNGSQGIFHGNFGQLLFNMGQPEKALPYLKKSIELAPRHTEPYYILARIITLASDAIDLIETIEKNIDSFKLEEKQQSDLNFALYHAHHFLKNDEVAFRYLQKANQLKALISPFNKEKVFKFFDQLKSLPQLPKMALPESSINRPIPIFILGMPRSGTTLVEQIISSHSLVSAGGEMPIIPEIAKKTSYPCPLNTIALARLEELTRSYFEQAGMDHTPYFTDKLPGNFFYIGLIKALWPNAKIIHCLRDPIDTCLSNYQLRYRNGHEYVYDLQSLGQFYCHYDALMQHWKALYPDNIYEISYEKLVENQTEQSKQLLSFCGLKWEKQCLEFYKSEQIVRTASASQVRKKIYTTAINRWKRYETQLTPLLKELGKLTSYK